MQNCNLDHFWKIDLQGKIHVAIQESENKGILFDWGCSPLYPSKSNVFANDVHRTSSRMLNRPLAI